MHALAIAALGFLTQNFAAQTQAWGFEKDKEGFTGPCVRDEGVAKSGAASLQVDADLRFGGRGVTVSKRLGDLDHDLTAIRFWIKSNDVTGITFRLVDRTNQVHQQRPTFQADGEWHLIDLTTFDAGKGYESWGGAKDRKWHGPPRSISIDVDQGYMKGKRGKLWID